MLLVSEIGSESILLYFKKMLLELEKEILEESDIMNNFKVLKDV